MQTEVQYIVVRVKARPVTWQWAQACTADRMIQFPYIVPMYDLANIGGYSPDFCKVWEHESTPAQCKKAVKLVKGSLQRQVRENRPD
jgi:hypothetical protein